MARGIKPAMDRVANGSNGLARATAEHHENKVTHTQLWISHVYIEQWIFARTCDFPRCNSEKEQKPSRPALRLASSQEFAADIRKRVVPS